MRGFNKNIEYPDFLLYHAESFQVLTVYMSGVLAGSLGTSLTDSSTYLAGASAGVYALIAAHLSTLVLNWQEDSNIRIQKVILKIDIQRAFFETPCIKKYKGAVNLFLYRHFSEFII